MTAVLDASKTGNLNELKRLKEVGTPFGDVDENGNTALLWAGSYGHLKVVQWLLSTENGSSDVTERNNNGNTVLLLAATFGHLDVVRWLLSSEGGASIEESNEAHRTALLQAIIHGQLSVIDYLIRAHYLEQGIDEKLRQQLILHTKHKSVHYYLEALDILSQKKVDETKLSLLLSKASSQLKFEELSHIYLICGWMQVISNSKVINSFTQDIDFTNQHFMAKLIGDHQHELFIKMFEQGHILLDWFIDANKLVVTNMRLDERLCQLIQNQLNQAEHDGFLKQQSSEKQKSLYLDCYVKPLYYSMLLATRSRSSIEDALQDPFTYHLSHEDLDVGPDSAKWIAYHLSQRIDTSVETHQKAYSRMKGLSRQIYYDTVKETMGEATYILCLRSDDFVINENHVSLELERSGILKYSVFRAVDGSNVNGEIPGSVLGFSPGDSLTFEQLVALKSVVLELISKNGHIPLQKKSLLLTLGNLTEVNGERLYWTKELPNWRRNLSRELSSENQGQDTLALIGEEQPVVLHSRFVQQIWDREQHVPRPTLFPGNHSVYKLELSSGKFIFCKLYPGLPGINDSLQYLYRRILGAQGGLPWSVTGLLKIDNQVIPALFSEDAGTIVEKNDLRLDNLDRKTLSKLILFCLLTNPEDGKLPNHTLIRNLRGSYDIFSVDNDQGLVEPTKANYSWFGYSKKPSLFVKSLLFCLDAMKEPLDEDVVKEFLGLDTKETLKAWLNDLIPIAEAYEVLFSDCKNPNEEQNPYRKSYVNLVLPVATVFHIAYKMQRIKTLLNEYHKTTPLKLLEAVEPVIFSYYEPVLLLPLSATDRFDKLVQEGGLYRWCAKTQSYSSTVTCANEVFDFLVSDNRGKDVNPKIALEELERFHQRWETFDLEALRVIKGEIAQLFSLKVEEQQALLKHTLLNQMSMQKRKLLLEALAKQKSFNELYLRYPQASLTDSLLISLLSNNKALGHLSITNGLGLTSLSAFNGAPTLTHLKLSQLPQIKEFTATLPNLTELVLKDLPHLSSLQINAPNLKSLRIIDCKSLENIELPESKELAHVEMKGCGKAVFANFYMQWPGFISRFNDVPPKFRHRLINCITKAFIEPVFVQRHIVYHIVTCYLDRLTVLLEWMKQRNGQAGALEVAFILAYLGYDHPLVIANIVKALGADDWHMRRDAVDALSILQSNDLTVIRGLLKALVGRNTLLNYDQDDFHVRQNAANALGLLQVRDEAVIWGLLNALRDTDQQVCANAANSLIMLFVEDKQALSQLLNVLKKRNIIYCNRILIADDEINNLLANHIEDKRIVLELVKALTREPYGLPVRYYLPGFREKYSRSPEPWIAKLYTKQIERIKESWTDANDKRNVKQVDDLFYLNLLDDKDPDVRFVAGRDLMEFIPQLENALGPQFFNLISLAEDSTPESSNDVLIEKEEDETNSTPIIEEHIASSMVATASEEIRVPIQSIAEDELDEIDSVSPIVLVAESSNALTVVEDSTSESSNDVLIEEEDETYSPPIIEEHVASSTLTTAREEIYVPMQSIVEDEQGEIDSVSPIALVAESSNALTINEPKGRSSDNKNRLFQRPGYHIKVGVGVLPTDVPADLFSLTEQGDLTRLIEVLSKKDVVNVFARNKEGNSALGIAAKKGHLAVLDHLIRYYYVPLGFSDKEKQGFESSEHLAIRHYLNLFMASLQKPAYDKVLQLLNKAVEELSDENRSFIYLIYLWMQVHQRVHSSSHAAQMHQLQGTHQMELTQYMIQEGHVLNDWAINSEELVLRDMTLDEHRVDALAGLLENSAYEFSLMVPGGLIEPNKIYLNLIGQALQYQVMACSGTVVTAQIDSNLLKCNLTHPFSLDQLEFIPDLLKIISNRGHIRSIINTLTFDKVHFTKEGYESFLKILKNPLLVPWLQTLKLNHCHLGDQQIDEMSYSLINRSELIYLDLDNNNITYLGLSNLLDELYSGKSSVKLNTLSLCFNYIQIISQEYLYSLVRKDSEMKINLKGNMIADNEIVGLKNKKEHKKRVDVLLLLFLHISKQAPHLTINDFLTATNFSLERCQNGGGYLLRLTLSDLTIIEISINSPLFDIYNQLSIKEVSQDLYENIPKTRAQKIFSYLRANINEKEIPEELRHSPLPKNIKQQQVCKQLLNYHPDASLKGHLITHSLFSSPRTNKAPSYLFPEIELTLEQGVVYFFSRKDSMHSMLGYEYLTGYGQRILNVVHLKLVSEEIEGAKRKRMKVFSFNRTNLSILINTLHQECDIAWIPATTKGLRRMRNTIEVDLAKAALDGSYKTAIMPSSREEDIDDKLQIKNCVTYCVDKINKSSLGFKLRVADLWFFKPSSIVAAIKDNPDSIIVFNSPMLQMK